MILTPNFYNNAIEFATVMARKNRNNNIEAIDIVHNVIVNYEVKEDNWKQLIVAEIKQALGKTPELNFTYLLENKFHKYMDYNDKRCCKQCGETYNSNMFENGFNGRDNALQYRNTCTTCHNENKKQQKKYVISAAQKAIYDQKRKERRALEKKLLGKIKDDNRNERVKRYWQNQKANLSDAYILKLLKGKKKKHIAFSAEDIATKRSSIIKINAKQEKLCIFA